MSKTATTDPGKGHLGVRTGDAYRASLDDGRELYLDGKRITDPANHPAFKPSVDELARLFDLQHDPEHAP